MAVIGTTEALAVAGDRQLAASIYREWLDHNPNDPLCYVVNFNLSVMLSALADRQGARIALLEAIRLKPDFLPAYINLGTVLEGQGDRIGAVMTWYDAVDRLSAVNADALTHKAITLKQLARVLSAANLHSNAEDVLRQSLEIGWHQRDILHHWLSMRQRQCKWPMVQPVAALTRAQVVAGLSPLSLAAYTDDPLLQLGVAADYCRHDVGRPSRSFAAAHRRRSKRHTRLRIGYLSSDLREHAIGHLLAELFELHNRRAVEVSAYYCGHQVDDALHHRFKASADHWIDISGMNDETAGERIVADGIDILVDVNGYTHSARSALVAMRPAPVIVNWLGFPSTMGSPYHDYIIADNIIIPEGSETFYSENVKRLPCYQLNDRRRIVSDHVWSRSEAGLPADGTVFCCFNALNKITPFTWQRWMRILQAVPGSVLWLLDGLESQLQEHAAAAGIAPNRLVFAPRLNNSYHLSRYVLADLFLDTSPYGAHTTGSDALWMGVPVLTVPGRSFASRVCASLVSAAGLPDLVCASSEAYVARAIELGTDRRLLEEYRRRLQVGRDSCVLFDTPLLVASLEELYRDMWAEHQSGRIPRPDLTNLDQYREIGAMLDRDDVEMSEVPDYRERYLEALADRNAFSMIQPDPRLWQGPSAGRRKPVSRQPRH